ncbi:hypothetical protein ACHAWX_003271 [Stephanocyclus meneghinianus]
MPSCHPPLSAPSLVNLKLGLSNFNHMGKFDDDGLKCMGRALRTNQSVHTMFIHTFAELTAVGGEALLRAA